jgi:hypothetical protein
MNQYEPPLPADKKTTYFQPLPSPIYASIYTSTSKNESKQCLREQNKQFLREREQTIFSRKRKTEIKKSRSPRTLTRCRWARYVEKADEEEQSNLFDTFFHYINMASKSSAQSASTLIQELDMVFIQREAYQQKTFSAKKISEKQNCESQNSEPLCSPSACTLSSHLLFRRKVLHYIVSSLKIFSVIFFSLFCIR